MSAKEVKKEYTREDGRMESVFMIRSGREKNPYLIAYFNKHNIAIGQEWKSWEYMVWIDKKHTAFRKLHRMPEHITLSDEQVKVFCEYINE